MEKLIKKIVAVLPIIFSMDERISRIEASQLEQNNLLRELLKAEAVNTKMYNKLFPVNKSKG